MRPPVGGQGAFASAAAPGLGRAPRTHARAALGQVADLLGRDRGRRGPAPSLHLGAGTGILTGQLHRAGVPLVAIERDPVARAQLRRALPRLPVVDAARAALPFADGSLPAVVVTDGAVVRDESALAEVARVLAPDAPLVLVLDRPVDPAPADPTDLPGLDGWAAPEASVHEEAGPPGGPPLVTEVVVWRRQ